MYSVVALGAGMGSPWLAQNQVRNPPRGDGVYHPPTYSGSAGSLNSTVNLMLPWPNCGNPFFVGSPGSRFDAVSSGGNSTSEFRNVCRAICSGSRALPFYLGGKIIRIESNTIRES